MFSHTNINIKLWKGHVNTLCNINKWPDYRFTKSNIFNINIDKMRKRYLEQITYIFPPTLIINKHRYEFVYAYLHKLKVTPLSRK